MKIGLSEKKPKARLRPCGGAGSTKILRTSAARGCDLSRLERSIGSHGGLECSGTLLFPPGKMQVNELLLSGFAASEEDSPLCELNRPLVLAAAGETKSHERCATRRNLGAAHGALSRAISRAIK